MSLLSERSQFVMPGERSVFLGTSLCVPATGAVNMFPLNQWFGIPRITVSDFINYGGVIFTAFAAAKLAEVT